ncbi:uncharacterized protein LOC131075250 [Cryptomeria japonica]|uniref:uncharacterized protein LOC131075250 n=1 Tax=Cryptomeria japonica TaxID=3369 RepID=UPI0027DA2F6B|nr:uncharacterized protein LOC131075250 [Cryptomeria japonica]
MWASHLDFRDLVRNWWATQVQGTAMFRIVEKLKLINREVKGWNKATFGDIFKKKKVLGSRMEQIQSIMAIGNPPDPILMEEEECHKNRKDILSKEEIYWKQRSIIQWLKEGDKNLAFFHRSAYIHRRRNFIKILRDDSDQEIIGDSLIRQSATDFFIGLYTESGRNDVSLEDSLLSKLLNAIEEEDNCQLLAPISSEEVHVAIFCMGAYKILSPDRFPLTFFQDYWEIVKYDVTKAEKDFFKTGKLLKKLNNTYIVLVPKAENPNCMKDF